MTVLRHLWAGHKLAAMSFVSSALEIVFVWGTAVAVQASGHHAVWIKIASCAWILGTLSALLMAAIALIIDPRRQIALLSLAVAVITFFICGLPMVV